MKPKTSDGDPLDEQTSLPKDLHILGAMNSADRSVAPLDAALRRRFAIVYVGPDYEVLRERLAIPADFELGESVKVTSGPLSDFDGEIVDVNGDQQKLKVLVNIFERQVPVELSFDQVKKLD